MRSARFLPGDNRVLIPAYDCDRDGAAGDAERAIFGAIGRHFVQHQSQRRGGARAKTDAVACDLHRAGAGQAIGRHEHFEQAFQILGLDPVDPQRKFLSARKSADRVRQDLGERFVHRVAARVQRDKADDDRENVLDAVSQLSRQKLALFGNAGGVVNIGQRAKPARGVRVLGRRHRPAEHPAIAPIGLAHLPFVFKRGGVLQRFDKFGARGFKRIGVNDRAPVLDMARRGQARDLAPARVDVIELRVRASRPGDVGHAVDHELKALRARSYRGVDGPGFAVRQQPSLHRLSQNQKPVLLKRGQAFGPRNGVEHTQRAQRRAFFGNERGAGVKAQMLLACDQRKFGKSRVLGRIGHHQDFAGQHGVRAKAGGTRRLAYSHAFAGQKDLPLGFNQTDRGGWRFAQMRGKAGQARHLIVTVKLGHRIAGERHQAIGLIAVLRFGIGAGWPGGLLREGHGAFAEAPFLKAAIQDRRARSKRLCRLASCSRTYLLRSRFAAQRLRSRRLKRWPLSVRLLTICPRHETPLARNILSRKSDGTRETCEPPLILISSWAKAPK